MPKDPNVAMQLAARVNGLGSSDMKPWHLKANYQTFDADGKPKDTGVFEEWWAGPEKYKISYASVGFNQVQYRDGDKTWMTGYVKWPPFLEGMVERLLVHPLPSASGVEAQKYVANDMKIGAAALMCLRQAVPSQYTALSTYCLEKTMPIVRIEEPYANGIVAFFNNDVKVNGQYVAKRIKVQNTGRPLLNIDLTVLEFPPRVEDADFAAPADAAVAPSRVELTGGVIASNRISGTDVKYPSAARSAREQGTVVLHAVIDKKGVIDDLRVVSGPRILQQAALDAVKTWRYKPYLLNGQPMEVETQITVVFQLGG
jgi:TonB family protein